MNQTPLSTFRRVVSIVGACRIRKGCASQRRAVLLEAATAFAVQSRREDWEIERVLNTLTLLRFGS